MKKNRKPVGKRKSFTTLKMQKNQADYRKDGMEQRMRFINVHIVNIII
jgi:hypothetical protein